MRQPAGDAERVSLVHDFTSTRAPSASDGGTGAAMRSPAVNPDNTSSFPSRFSPTDTMARMRVVAVNHIHPLDLPALADRDPQES